MKMLGLFLFNILISATLAVPFAEILNAADTKTFLKIANQVGLFSNLNSGSYTIFAPNDAAFNKLPPAFLKDLQNHKAALFNMLRYHVIPRKIVANDIRNEMKVPSLMGKQVRLNTNGQVTLAQGVKVVDVDRIADNGVVHVISELMKPPKGTVLDLLKNDRKYSKYFELAKSNANTLLSNKDANLTVFVWENPAWNRLMANSITNGLKYVPELLGDVIKYHIIPETIYTGAFTQLQNLTSVLGQAENVLTIQLYDNGNKVNYASITASDTSATNGVIHTVNKVLLPQQLMDLARQMGATEKELADLELGIGI